MKDKENLTADCCENIGLSEEHMKEFKEDLIKTTARLRQLNVLNSRGKSGIILNLHLPEKNAQAMDTILKSVLSVLVSNSSLKGKITKDKNKPHIGLDKCVD